MPYMLSLFPCLLHFISCSKAIDVDGIKNDLNEFNITCPIDSCDYNETDSLSARSCLCGIQCVQLGACCIDSYYVDAPQPKVKPSCRSVYNSKSYYVIDHCPDPDSIWYKLCNDEWDGDDDVQKLVPVTSLRTLTTYKNFYCFRCHETSDEFLHWVIKVDSYSHFKNEEAEKSGRHISLTYNKTTLTWMCTYNEETEYIPVTVSLRIPEEIEKLVHVCVPDVISNCSEKWSDDAVRNKCHSYMALIKAQGDDSMPLKYKNVHCALCNFASISDIICWSQVFTFHSAKKPFSFTYLLDINRSDGELVGKIQRCPSDQVWDPYTKKCRKLTCALPGYKVKNRKCVQE